MENLPRPVFMTFCQQWACVDSPMELTSVKAMHHFIFQNMIIGNSKLDKNSAFFLTGAPNNMIEDILISNVQFVVSGRGTKEDAAKTVKEYMPEVLGECVYDGIWVGKNSKIHNVEGIRKDFVEGCNEAGVTDIRWPGGCFADHYHWKYGIGF